MSVATTTAIAIAAGAAAAGGITSAAIGASASKSAAATQAKGEQTAQQIQEQEWNQQQANEAPFITGGQTAENNLSNLVDNPSFSQYPGGTFQTPTLQQAEQMPGYQFQLQQGTQAIDENAAATGNLESGTTGTALENYGQGLAQTGYNNLYNQALNTYMTNYGVWNQDTTNQVNRLQALTNTGASAAANSGQQGQAAAAALGNEAVGESTAQASGTVGAANAITGGVSAATSGLSQLPLYALLGQQQQNQSSYPGEWGPGQGPETGVSG